MTLSGSRAIRFGVALAIILCSDKVVGRLAAQDVTSGFVYGGVTTGKHLDGAGRFGVGVDFNLAPHFDVGGEIGTIHKNDVGVLASGNLSYHFTRPRRREELDPFLTIGLSGARISGTSGFYLNLGGGVNYWFTSRVAFRGEFKGYPGGQDLGGFAEFRFGVTFRP
jgi:hypothetical protein